MKPSDIFLGTFMPLTATFGRVEAEVAAAIIIATLAATGDTWRPVGLAETTVEILRPFDWASNPFAKPSIDELVDRGFATLSEGNRTIELTGGALEMLRDSQWNRSSKSGEP